MELFLLYTWLSRQSPSIPIFIHTGEADLAANLAAATSAAAAAAAATATEPKQGATSHGRAGQRSTKRSRAG